MSTAARPKHLLPLIGDASLFEQTLARFGDRARFGAADHRRQPGAGGGAARPARAGRRGAADPRADEARQRPGDRAGRARRRAGRSAADEPERPSYRRRRRLPRRDRGGPRRGRGGRHRHLRDRARPSRHRLRLYRRRAPGEGVRRVERFIEKPAADHAEALLAAGGHYWNAGIFLARAATWLAAMERHVPDIVDGRAARRSTRPRATAARSVPTRKRSRARRRSRSIMR